MILVPQDCAAMNLNAVELLICSTEKKSQQRFLYINEDNIIHSLGEQEVILGSDSEKNCDHPFTKGMNNRQLILYRAEIRN